MPRMPLQEGEVRKHEKRPMVLITRHHMPRPDRAFLDRKKEASRRKCRGKRIEE